MLEAVETGGSPSAGVALFGRILMSAIFIGSGLTKLMSLDQTAGYMTHAGIPAAHALAVIAALVEICGGLAVLLGFLTQLATAGLFLYLIPVTLIFHHFWGLHGMERQMQMANFMKNLAIMGGLAVLFARGPGRLSLDAKLFRRI